MARHRLTVTPAAVAPGSAEADPVVAAYLRDVDRTLIRQNLALSVESRLSNLQALLALADELQRAGRKARRT